MVCLCSVCLVHDAAHAPRLRITGLVVRHDVDVIAANVSIAQVIHHVQTVRGGRLMDLHADARRQQAVGSLVVGQVGVIGIRYPVTGLNAQPVSKRVADSLTLDDQLFIGLDVDELASTFQRRNDAVGGVSVVDRFTDRTTGRHVIQTVCQQEVGTLPVVQACNEVVLEDIGQVAFLVVGGIKRLHDVERIQVTPDIILGEVVAVTGVEAKQLGPDKGNHGFEVLVQIALDDRIQVLLVIIVIDRAQQVNQVASPAADVSMVHTTLVVVGDVHGAEHVAQVSQVTVGQVEFLEVLQAADLNHVLNLVELGVVLVFLLVDILGKARILVASHDAPGAGIVAVNTSTDVLDDQVDRINVGRDLGVLNRPLLQVGQVGNQFLVGIDGLFTQGLDLYVSRVGAARTSLVSLPTNGGEGRLLGRVLHDVVAQRVDGLLRHQRSAAQCTARAFSLAGFQTLSRNLFHSFRHMHHIAFGVTTVLTGCGCRAVAGRHVMLNLFGHHITAALAQTGRRNRNTGCNIELMAGLNHLLGHNGGTADGAVAALSQTISGTSLLDRRISNLGMRQLLNSLDFGGTAALNSTDHLLGTFLGAGCFNQNLRILPGMCRRNDFLSQLDKVALGAMAALSQTGFCTGGSNILINDDGVGCHDFLGLLFSTTGIGTSEGQRTSSRTSMLGFFHALIPGMAQSGNGILLEQDNTALRTDRAFGQTSFGTGCSLRLNHLSSMALRGNEFLLEQNFITNGAVLAFAHAGGQTGRSSAFVNDNSMIGCRDRFLSNQNLIADGAVLAFSLTIGGTGFCNRLIDNNGMALCLNNFLLHQDFITDGAVLTSSLTIRGTGHSNRFIDHFSVTQRRIRFLLLQDGAADRALQALSQTSNSTSGLDSLHDLFGMALSVHILLRNDDRVTDGAVLAFGLTLFGTSRFNRLVDNLGMAVGVHILLCNDNHVTNGAVLTFGLTLIGTGCRNSLVNDLGMTISRSGLLCSQNRITDRTVLAFSLTRFGTSRFNRLIDHLSVASSSLGLGGLQDSITDRTLLACSRTGLCASRLNRSNDLFRMVLLGDLLAFGQPSITIITEDASSQTGIGTGSLLLVIRLRILMTSCRLNHLSYSGLATDRAMLTSSLTIRGTRCSNSLVNHFGMASSLCHRGFLRDGIANCARLTVTLIAIRLTSGGLSRQRCGSMCQSAKHLLLDSDRLTDGTLFAFSQASSRTGCCTSR